MILVDTSVWVDHLRRGDAVMQRALVARQVVVHPLVIGEIALGEWRLRDDTLRLLATLPSGPVASAAEVLTMIDQHRLYGRGIGLVDVHLLASAALAHDTAVWTRDRRLALAAAELGLLHADTLH